MTAVERTKAPKFPKILYLLLLFQAFAAFWSESKLVPNIPNNIGFFELSSALLIGVVFAFYYKHDLPLRGDPLITLIGVWFVLAAVSIVNLFDAESYRIVLSGTQASIFLFQLLFTLVLYNILTTYPELFPFLLKCMFLAAALAGIWIIIAQLRAPGNYNVSGPFRGRSQMGLYMLGAFWLVLFYRSWPGIPNWARWLTLPVLAVSLYAVAASLRQSVYSAMVVGLVGLLASFVFLTGQKRFRLSSLILLFSLMLAVLYFGGGQYVTQLNLFNREFSSLPQRLVQATATGEDTSGDDNAPPTFDEIQHQGILKAFTEHPVLGIGWAGFYHSDYSSNEIHSTPWRFLAELGIVGFTFYIVFMALLFFRAFRLFVWARGTAYEMSSFILCVALLSYFVSHYYNRMFTDRPYWFVLVIVLVVEDLLKQLKVQKADAAHETPPALQLKPVVLASPLD